MPARRQREGEGAGLQAALRDLRRGVLRPLYLLHGHDAFLRDRFVRAIRKAALAGGSADFNHDVFDWGQSQPADVVAAAQTLPFMAPRRLVEVRGFNPKRGRGEEGGGGGSRGDG